MYTAFSQAIGKDDYSKLDNAQLQAINEIDLEVWALFSNDVISDMNSGHYSPQRIREIAERTIRENRTYLKQWGIATNK